MAAPSTNEEFLELVRKSGVVDEKRLDTHMKELRATGNVPAEPGKLAGILVRDGILTHFQAEQFLLGKWRRFTIGKYKVLERLGSGGMGSVYLCEHKFMRRRVAVKVLPAAKAEDPSSLERFYREARAAAALDHPNIVRAYDIDQDDNLHFLVMEYVDGASLQEMVKKHGPMDVLRAAHYIRQAAIGLHHAHEADLVHRDIKPGNLLVDRSGTVRVLDMGLARFFHDEEDILTKKYDENVLGTADYLAPEQALDSHGVDIRADIYSLGATFYYLLTGNPPFSEGTVAQKLIWHQTRQPKSVRTVRPDVPEGLVAIVEKMMAKDAAQRYQVPIDVAEALTPWTQTPIPPPPEAEMPRLSLAAVGSAPGEAGQPPPRPSSALIPTPLRKAPSGTTPSAPPGRSPTPEIRSEAGSATATSAAPRGIAGATALQTPAAGTQPSPLFGNNGLATLAAGSAARGEEDPAAPWDRLAADSDHPSARAETVAASADKTSSTRPRLPRPGLPATPHDRRQLRILLASVAGAIVVLLGVLLWLALRGPDPTPTPPSPSVGDEKNLLIVSRTMPGAFRTLREALAKAKVENTTIEIHEEALTEPLRLDDLTEKNLSKGLNIIGVGPNGQPVKWQAVSSKGPPSLLQVYSYNGGAEGLRVKNFVFDGNGVVDDLVLLLGRCRGLTLEDVQFRGFKNSAVKLMNCAGTEDNYVQLVRLRATASKDKPAETALIFEIKESVRSSPRVNQYIRVQDCRFEGPLKTAVQFFGPVANVELSRNRIFHVDDGIRYRTQRPGGGPWRPYPQIHLTLESNTFCQVSGTALRFEGVPLTNNQSHVVVRDNLFAKTAALAGVDDSVAPEQLQAAAKPILTVIGNVRDPESKQGNLRLNVNATGFTLPIDPNNNDTFLRYPKDSPLATAGDGKAPVGAPPLE